MGKSTNQSKRRKPLASERNKKRPVTKVVWIGGDEELAQELQEARGQRHRLNQLIEVRGDEASDNDRQTLADLDTKINDLTAKLRETAIKFVFESIGRKRYDKLIKDHPPTKEQIDEAKKNDDEASWNPDTFPAALVDACCVEPEHEKGELGSWIFDDPDDEWNFAEQMELFNAAVEVNLTRTRIDLGKG